MEISVHLAGGRDSKTTCRHNLSPGTRGVARNIDRSLSLSDRIGLDGGVPLDRLQNWGSDMHGTRLRSTGKSIVAALCTASFLTMNLGSVSRAVAADSWETWPKKTAEPRLEQIPATDANGAAKDWEAWPKTPAEPGLTQKPATDANGAARDWKALPKTTAEPGLVQRSATDASGAAKAEDAAAKKKSTGRSYRTIGWIALGIAAVIGIAIAAGGGGDEGGAVTNPGHH